MAVGVYFPFVSIPIDAAGPHSQGVSYVLFSQTSRNFKIPCLRASTLQLKGKGPLSSACYCRLLRVALPSFPPSWLQVRLPHSALIPSLTVPSPDGHVLRLSFACAHASLCLVFIFGSLLWISVVPVFSTNIPCSLVKTSSLHCSL